MKKPQPLHEFKVRAYSSGRLHYKVKIWPTKKAMQAGVDNPVPGDYKALCQSYVKEQLNKKTKRKTISAELGTVHFFKARMGAGIVSHEFCHAAMNYIRRKRVSIKYEPQKHGLVHDSEELFCHSQGMMVSQFVEKCYKLGLYG